MKIPRVKIEKKKSRENRVGSCYDTFERKYLNRPVSSSCSSGTPSSAGCKPWGIEPYFRRVQSAGRSVTHGNILAREMYCSREGRIYFRKLMSHQQMPRPHIIICAIFPSAALCPPPPHFCRQEVCFSRMSTLEISNCHFRDFRCGLLLSLWYYEVKSDAKLDLNTQVGYINSYIYIYTIGEKWYFF